MSTDLDRLVDAIDALTVTVGRAVAQARLANLIQASYTIGSSEALDALRVNIGSEDEPVYLLRAEVAELLDLDVVVDDLRIDHPEAP